MFREALKLARECFVCGSISIYGVTLERTHQVWYSDYDFYIPWENIMHFAERPHFLVEKFINIILTANLKFSK